MKKLFYFLSFVGCIAINGLGAVASLEDWEEYQTFRDRYRVSVIHVYHKGEAQEKDKAWKQAYDHRTKVFEDLSKMEDVAGVAFGKINKERAILKGAAQDLKATKTPVFIIFKKKIALGDAEEVARLTLSSPFDSDNLSMKIRELLFKHAAEEIKQVQKDLREARSARRAAWWIYDPYWHYPYGVPHPIYYPYYDPYRYYGYGRPYGGVSFFYGSGFGRGYRRFGHRHARRSGFHGRRGRGHRGRRHGGRRMGGGRRGGGRRR